MRYMHFTHAVLASLLWCMSVAVFAGMCFMTYSEAARGLDNSRIEMILSSLRQKLQNDIDKGSTLSRLNKADPLFAYYIAEDSDISSISVFGSFSGKILFSTDLSKSGEDVPAEWMSGCLKTEGVFAGINGLEKIKGTPVLNAFNENMGCIVIQYTDTGYETGYRRMRAAVLKAGAGLSLTGIALCFLLYFFGSCVPNNKWFRNLFYRRLIFWGALLFLIFSIPVQLSVMFSSFEAILHKNMALKSQMVARLVQSRVQHAVQKKIPLKSLKGVESYLESIRQKNPEILFILLTDKSGRVLFESGSAVQAFKADAWTGKVTLRQGYYNAAEQISAGKSGIGWVQVGVNERFVREKIY